MSTDRQSVLEWEQWYANSWHARPSKDVGYAISRQEFAGVKKYPVEYINKNGCSRQRRWHFIALEDTLEAAKAVAQASFLGTDDPMLREQRHQEQLKKWSKPRHVLKWNKHSCSLKGESDEWINVTILIARASLKIEYHISRWREDGAEVFKVECVTLHSPNYDHGSSAHIDSAPTLDQAKAIAQAHHARSLDGGRMTGSSGARDEPQ